jgi:heat shock protein HtpX
MSAYSQQRANVKETYLLIFIFIGLVSSIFLIFAYALDNIWISVVGLALSIAQALGAYYFGDKIALSVARAKQIKYEDNPQIFEMVQNLSKIADIPVPKIYISPDPSANAFACGRDPKHASVCFNQGILNLLNKNELEGVTAHELSHIKNRDILVMTVTMVLASTVAFISDIGGRLLWSGGRNSKGSKSPVILIFAIITIIIAPIVATMIKLAVSRKREFLADATGVTLTRYPQGLASALNKLYTNPVPSNNYSTSMAHFYIAPPKKTFGEKIAGVFSTHPPIEERIEALKKM